MYIGTMILSAESHRKCTVFCLSLFPLSINAMNKHLSSQLSILAPFLHSLQEWRCNCRISNKNMTVLLTENFQRNFSFVSRHLAVERNIIGKKQS